MSEGRTARTGCGSAMGTCLVAATVMIFSCSSLARAQESKTIGLNAPDRQRGLPFMEALSVKASAGEWSERELSVQDLSDLLWAANGLNRPEERKCTASSAQNAHDVELYVFMKKGVYDADKHALTPVLAGDHRSELMMTRSPRPKDAPGPAPSPPPAVSNPPMQIILVSDCSRFKAGPPELTYEWGAIEGGGSFCRTSRSSVPPRGSKHGPGHPWKRIGSGRYSI